VIVKFQDFFKTSQDAPIWKVRTFQDPKKRKHQILGHYRIFSASSIKPASVYSRASVGQTMRRNDGCRDIVN